MSADTLPCALPGCGNPVTRKGAEYCCRAHQKLHWKQNNPDKVKEARIKQNQARKAFRRGEYKPAPWAERRAAIVAKYGQRYENRHAPMSEAIRSWKAAKVG